MRRIEEICGGEVGELLIAVGEGTHEMHRFPKGMELSGCSAPVEDPRKETAVLYKQVGSRWLRMPRVKLVLGRLFMACPLTWKPTGIGDIVAWMPGPATRNARLVFGAVGSRWK